VTGRGAGRRLRPLVGPWVNSGCRIDERTVRHSPKQQVMCIIHTMQRRELIKLLQADG
jgi:hypothetical protein